MGYLAFKREAMESRLHVAVRKYEAASAAPSDPSPPEGANMTEVKKAWRYTADTKNLDFNERLPESERSKLRAGESALEEEAHHYDRQGLQGEIEGVYLEQVCSF